MRRTRIRLRASRFWRLDTALDEPAEPLPLDTASQGWAITLAVLTGIPAYLNGFAAIRLVAGLIGLGMSQAAGLGFMLGGGVTSIPAMVAVYALVRPKVVAWYLALATTGALAGSYAYAAVLAVR